MRHGITISDRDKEEMLGFFARGVADGQPPSWISWVVYDNTTDDPEITGSPVSSEESDEEYHPFVHLRENPDGKRCRCGSTTHLTVNSHACPLNPRNRDDKDDATGESKNTDDQPGAEKGDTAAADGSAAAADESAAAADGNAAAADGSAAAADDSAAAADDSDTPDEEEQQTLAEIAAALPVRRRRSKRLGVSARKRRLITDTNNTKAKSQTIQLGAEVVSSGSRWNLPANTKFKGVVVARKNRRGVSTFDVKWQDGVVEYMNEDDIRPMCVNHT